MEHRLSRPYIFLYGAPVIFRQQVNIVKDETSEIVQLEGFDVTDVHQDSSIESVFVGLFDDEQSIVELLTLQDGVKVVDECAKEFDPISEMFMFFILNITFFFFEDSSL